MVLRGDWHVDVEEPLAALGNRVLLRPVGASQIQSQIQADFRKRFRAKGDVVCTRKRPTHVGSCDGL